MVVPVTSASPLSSSELYLRRSQAETDQSDAADRQQATERTFDPRRPDAGQSENSSRHERQHDDLKRERSEDTPRVRREPREETTDRTQKRRDEARALRRGPEAVETTDVDPRAEIERSEAPPFDPLSADPAEQATSPDPSADPNRALERQERSSKERDRDETADPSIRERESTHPSEEDRASTLTPTQSKDEEAATHVRRILAARASESADPEVQVRDARKASEVLQQIAAQQQTRREELREVLDERDQADEARREKRAEAAQAAKADLRDQNFRLISVVRKSLLDEVL